MKHLAPSFFRAFACAGGRCPDSCCRAGWEIVPDEETLKLYKTFGGAAGARVQAGITSGNEPLLCQDENRVCVLLDPDGLCHVQKNFGHEALCRVCREYPRFHREFGNLTEHGVSLSCPTAYALAVGAPLQWESWEDEAPIVPNDLDPDAYLRLRRGRELALELLGREDLSLTRRIELIRKLAAAMQHAPERLVHHDYGLRLKRWRAGIRAQGSRIRGRREPSVGAVIGRPLYAAGNQMQNARFRMQNEWVRGNCQLFAPDRLAERFSSLEILSPAWKEQLERFRTMLRDEVGAHCAPLRRQNRACGRCAPLQGGLPETDQPEVYARYLACSLYKYWLDALDDGNLLGRVERSISMTLLGLAMDRALPGEGPFLQRISREIEHCEENLAALE